MFETEIKIKLRSDTETRKQLLQMGAQFKYFMHNSDKYYNFISGGKDFAKTDEALRLRSTILMDPITKQKIEEKHDLTYKGPKLKTSVKSRIEYESEVQNAEMIDKIIGALGFNLVIEIPKEREVFEIKYEKTQYTVLIDKIEGLSGYYLEAELMVAEEKAIPEAKQKLVNFVSKIGYNENDSIRESYLELVMKNKKR
jgi:adenylate cyclase class 2